MSDTLPCLRCGSDAVVPRVRLVDSYGEPGKLKLEREGGATLKELFTTAPSLKATARVCGDCGHIELVAETPGEVWDAHLNRLARR